MTGVAPRFEAAELRHKARQPVKPLSARSWYDDGSFGASGAKTPTFRFALSLIVGFGSGA